MEMPKLFDNLNSKVIDDLRITLKQSSKVSIAAASFSIYAYEALKEELEAIDELRFIFTSPTFNKEKASKEKREFFIPKLNRERNLFGSDFEIKLRNQIGGNIDKVYNAYSVSSATIDHFTTDIQLTRELIEFINHGDATNLSFIQGALDSHLACFAAEISREEERIVYMKELVGNER